MCINIIYKIVSIANEDGWRVHSLPDTRYHGRVYWLLFFVCPVTDISATVALIGVKFCMIVQSTYRPRTDLLPFWVRYP